MMGKAIRLVKSDVSVEQMFEECGNCTTTLSDAGWAVAIDFRNAGTVERHGPYCKPCALNFARRIQEGLPR